MQCNYTGTLLLSRLLSMPLNVKKNLWRRVLLEKLVMSQLARNSQVFYDIRPQHLIIFFEVYFNIFFPQAVFSLHGFRQKFYSLYLPVVLHASPITPSYEDESTSYEDGGSVFSEAVVSTQKSTRSWAYHPIYLRYILIFSFPDVYFPSRFLTKIVFSYISHSC